MDASPGAIGLEPAAQRIGRYRLVRRCAVLPGEAPAYVAFDPERDEQVVVQWVVVPPDQPVGEALLRLKGDVEASGRLGHPGLVQARALGIDEGRGPYLVREFVDAPNLSALPGMEADLHAALRILIQLARALTVADEAGVASRTLRLEDVFVTSTGQVRLQVFGLPHAGTPSSASSAYQLARAGLKLMVGALDLGEAPKGDAPQRLPAAFDKGLARAFGKAFEAEQAERFPTPVAFMQVLIAEAPLPEAQQHELLELVDQLAPIVEDPVVAEWARRIRPEPSPDDHAVPALAPGGGVAEPLGVGLEVAPVDSRAGPSRRSRLGLLVAGVVLVAALVVGGLALFAGRKPVTVRVESEPPGATLELDGRVVGTTPAELIDPAPGAHLRFSKEGFQPAESAMIAGQAVVRISLQPLPPPAPEAQAAPVPPTPEAAGATPEPQRPAARPAAASKPPGKAPAPEKEKRRFDLYKHLEKQSPGP